MAKMKMSYAEKVERNKSIGEKTLSQNPGDAKVVVAKSVEVQDIIYKIMDIERIFDRARSTMLSSRRNSLSMEDFMMLRAEYDKAITSIDAIIAIATEKGIHRPREAKKTSEFQANREKLEKMILAGSTNEEIADALDMKGETKVDGWIANIKAELSEKNADSKNEEVLIEKQESEKDKKSVKTKESA